MAQVAERPGNGPGLDQVVLLVQGRVRGQAVVENGYPHEAPPSRSRAESRIMAMSS